jgi:hypothetical protein
MRNKLTLSVLVLASTVMVGAMEFGSWGPSVSVESVTGTDPTFNTAFQDGCPAPSRDGLTIFMASNRPGGYGGLDIWAASRESAEDPWSAPFNLGAAINTAADEFCPTPLPNGRDLLMVSTRPGGCGGGDIYIARHHATRGWQTPVHLGCGVNSAAEEASPNLIEYEDGTRELYFSSSRAGGFSAEAPGTTPDADIYVALVDAQGHPGTPALAPGVNTAAQDVRPNLRRDGREILFDSTRPGGFGGADIWSATRSSRFGQWSAPVNAGANVNSAGNETRPYLSWGATTLFFGTTRAGVEGVGDIWMSHRKRQPGQ